MPLCIRLKGAKTDIPEALDSRKDAKRQRLSVAEKEAVLMWLSTRTDREAKVAGAGEESGEAC